MARGLPEGLITPSESVKSSIQGVDRLGAEEIARLWKAFHANRTVLAEGVGQRLDNFFWRIWGSRRLLENTRGISVAAIFSSISEGGYIRTTPTQSPRSSRSLGVVHPAQQPQVPTASSQASPFTSHPRVKNLYPGDDVGDTDETERKAHSARKTKLPSRPPPILKKSKQVSPSHEGQIRSQALHGQDLPESTLSMDMLSGHDAPPARMSVVEAEPSDRSMKTARFNADELDSRVSTSSREQEAETYKERVDAPNKGKQRFSKRRVAEGGATGFSKGMPLVRQRFSQPTSGDTSATTSSRVISQASVNERLRQGSVAAEMDEKAHAEKPAVSSVDTSHGGEAEVVDRRKSLESRGLHDDGDSASQCQSGSGARPLPSHPSFTSMLAKPSKAAATSASDEASGIMDFGQEAMAGKNRSSGAEARRAHDRSPLAGVSQPVLGSSGTVQALPRSKSQLTLLLQRDRKPSNK